MASYQSPAFATSDPTAVVGKRIVAAIVDAIILTVIAIATANGLVDLKQEDTQGIDNACEIVDQAFCFQLNDTVYYSDNGGAAALIYGVPTVLALLNAVALQGVTGASVGKHLLGLRVVNKDSGGLAGMGKCFVRWLVGIVDVSCCFLIGLIMVITTKGHRRLGDMAAGTLVIGKESVGLAPVVPGVTAAAPAGWGSPTAAPTWPGQEPAWPAPPQMPQAPQQGYQPPIAPQAPVTPQPPPAAVPDPSQPQWDPARNAYIQWDPNANQWTQWDDATKQWRPIS